MFVSLLSMKIRPKNRTQLMIIPQPKCTRGKNDFVIRMNMTYYIQCLSYMFNVYLY
jgi:hypothetical protein